MNTPTIYYYMVFKKELYLNIMFKSFFVKISTFILLLVFSFLKAEICQAQLDTTDVNYQAFFYENGVKSSEGILKNGQPEGEWLTYYDDGILKTKGSRSKGELDGTWFFFRPNGNPEKELNYKSGILDGEELIFNSEGILLLKNFYSKGKKEGISLEFYADGKVKKEIPFSDDKENGKGHEYGTDGRIISFFTYKDGYLRTMEKVNRYNTKGKRTGKWIEYQGNSKKLKEEGNYSNGLKNGLFKIYNRRGDLDRIETYKNGELVLEDSNQILDVKKELGADGKVKSIGSFSNGKKQGIFREYDENGNIISSSIYKEDIKVAEGFIDGSGTYEGNWKIYYPTGELRAEGDYEQGNREGVWKYYFITGELEQRGKYKKDKPTGEWVWYFKNKEIKRQEYYRKGREDGESVEYDIQGKTINKGNYIDGLRTGDWFLTIGDYEEEGQFIDDEKNGDWKMFYKKTDQLYFQGEYAIGIPIKRHTYYWPNGQKKEEGKFQAGERHGDWKFFNNDGTVRLTIRYDNGIEVKINGEKV